MVILLKLSLYLKGKNIYIYELFSTELLLIRSYFFNNNIFTFNLLIFSIYAENSILFEVLNQKRQSLHNMEVLSKDFLSSVYQLMFKRKYFVTDLVILQSIKQFYFTAN